MATVKNVLGCLACTLLISGCAWLSTNAPQIIGTLETIGKICLECHTIKAPDIEVKAVPVKPAGNCPEAQKCARSK